MAHITFVTGGQRSGKSSFAQDKALDLSPTPTYLATSRIWDEDFKERVKRHQDDRGPEWENIEEEVNIHQTNLEGKVVVIDCITLWLTNIFYDNDSQLDISFDKAKTIWTELMKQDAELIVVSNEIGMGMHAETTMGRRFQDLQGWANQFIAKHADEVVFMVSGIPMKIK